MTTDFCGRCGACESHLLVAAEVERYMTVFSGDSEMNEKCCCGPKYLSGMGAKSDFQQLYNSQADEISSKIFGG